MQVPDDDEGAGAGALQSVQSVPKEHELNSAPGPPSSQTPSEAYQHVSVHVDWSARRTLEEGGGQVMQVAGQFDRWPAS